MGGGSLGLPPGRDDDHHLEVVPLSRQHWIVRSEGDVTPIAQAATLTEARAEARNFARQFGEPVIHVHELGECHTEFVDPDSARRRRAT